MDILNYDVKYIYGKHEKWRKTQTNKRLNEPFIYFSIWFPIHFLFGCIDISIRDAQQAANK